MKIQLPLETWMAVLDWIRRQELAKKLESHKLWDSQLTPITQYWLHEWRRNVQIGSLTAFKDHDSQTAGLCKNGFSANLMPIAASDLPGNISGFKQFKIFYLDSAIMAFLHKIRPLFQRVNLYFGVSTGISLRNGLVHLVPLLNRNDQISSIRLDETEEDQLEALFDFPSLYFNAGFLQINWIKRSSFQALIDWLFTPRADGQPRVLFTTSFYTEYFLIFLKEIREYFLASGQQTSFFIRIRIKKCDSTEELPDEKLKFENDKSEEQLTMSKVVRDDGMIFVLICKYPLKEAGREWLAHKETEVIGWEQPEERRIILFYPEVDPNINH